MKNQKIPNFKPEGYKFRFQLQEAWLSYIREHFISDTDTSAEQHAFNYNVSRLEQTLDAQQFDNWNYCLKVSAANLKNKYSVLEIGNLTATNLRTLFEHSDKSIEVINLTKLNLMNRESLYTFLTLNIEDKNLIKSIAPNEHNLTQCLYDINKNTTLDSKQLYILDSVYSEALSKQYAANILNGTLTSADDKSFQYNYIYFANMLFEQDTFIGGKDSLNKIVTITTMTKLIKNNPNYDTLCEENLNSLISKLDLRFKTEYPECYKQYQALDALGITPELKDFTLISEPCANISTIEFN